LEIFAHSVGELRSGRIESPAIPGIGFRFMKFPIQYIRQKGKSVELSVQRRGKIEKRNEELEYIHFERGKSCLFRANSDTLHRSLREDDKNLQFFLVDLNVPNRVQLLATATAKLDETKLGKRYTGEYMLHHFKSWEPVGRIRISARLFCVGLSSIPTRLLDQLNRASNGYSEEFSARTINWEEFETPKKERVMPQYDSSLTDRYLLGNTDRKSLTDIQTTKTITNKTTSSANRPKKIQGHKPILSSPIRCSACLPLFPSKFATFLPEKNESKFLSIDNVNSIPQTPRNFQEILLINKKEKEMNSSLRLNNGSKLALISSKDDFLFNSPGIFIDRPHIMNDRDVEDDVFQESIT